jgi:MFS family permease
MAHSFFIGQILGSVGLARIPDLFGRKWPIVYALAAQLPIYIATILSKNYYLSTVLAFLFGFLNVGIYNGGWINICEYTHGKWKNRLCLILLIADSTTVILSAFYFKFISNQWLYF